MHSTEEGTYQFPSVPGAQTYVLKAFKAGSVFTPAAMPIAYLADSVNQDFWATKDLVESTEKAPNQWTALNDHSKTVVTLASAALAVSVTFSGQLLSREADSLSNYILIATWILLILTIACSLLSAGFLVHYLRHKSRDRLAILCANCSYMFLFLAGASFLTLGWRSTIPRKSWDAAAVIDTTLQRLPAVFKNANPPTWKVQSLEFDPSSQTYKLMLVDQANSRRSQVWIDQKKHSFKADEILDPQK